MYLIYFWAHWTLPRGIGADAASKLDAVVYRGVNRAYSICETLLSLETAVRDVGGRVAGHTGAK